MAFRSPDHVVRELFLGVSPLHPSGALRVKWWLVELASVSLLYCASRGTMSNGARLDAHHVSMCFLSCASRVILLCGARLGE